MYFAGSKPKLRPLRPEDVVVVVPEAPPPRPIGRWLAVFWSVVAVKCAVVAWVHVRYGVLPDVPPGWIILPTLVFSGVVTWILLRRRW